MPNGVVATYTYDNAARLTAIQYAKNGSTLRNLSYTYDELNRKTTATGNPALELKDTVLVSAVVNSLNQYTSLEGQTVNHDLNGNQTQAPGVG